MKNAVWKVEENGKLMRRATRAWGKGIIGKMSFKNATAICGSWTS